MEAEGWLRDVEVLATHVGADDDPLDAEVDGGAEERLGILGWGHSGGPVDPLPLSV